MLTMFMARMCADKLSVGNETAKQSEMQKLYEKQNLEVFSPLLT